MCKSDVGELYMDRQKWNDLASRSKEGRGLLKRIAKNFGSQRRRRGGEKKALCSNNERAFLIGVGPFVMRRSCQIATIATARTDKYELMTGPN